MVKLLKLNSEQSVSQSVTKVGIELLGQLKSEKNSALKSAKNSNLLLKVPKIVPKKGLKIVSSY